MGKKRIVEQSTDEIKDEIKSLEEKRVSQVSKSSGKSKKTKKGRMYIKASYNNTFITATDDEGNVLAWMTAGTLGFKGPKKATPFAASKVAEAIAEKLSKTGLSDVEVFVKGIGAGRDSAIRTISAKGFNVAAIEDITPIPHGGPRPRKARRV